MLFRENIIFELKEKIKQNPFTAGFPALRYGKGPSVPDAAVKFPVRYARQPAFGAERNQYFSGKRFRPVKLTLAPGFGLVKLKLPPAV